MKILRKATGRNLAQKHNARYFCIFIILWFSIACKKQSPAQVEYKAGAIEKTSKDFLIPRAVREEIEKEYLKFIHRENPKVILDDAELIAAIPREYLNIELYFSAPDTGVLSENKKYILPRGGGEVDLKDLVLGKKGSFYMKFLVQHSSEPQAKIQDLHIYYLSEAKVRKVDGEKFGAGCKQYMDITNSMSAANNSLGLQLNATAQRYLSVVGGIMYFVDFSAERKLFLGAVRITDSRFLSLLCE